MAGAMSMGARDGQANNLRTYFNNGTLQLRTGTRPATPQTAPTGTVVATIALGATAFSASSAAVISKNGTWQDPSADASGTVTWGRFITSTDAGTTNDTDVRYDIDVGVGSGDLQLDNNVINVGQSVTVSNFSLTQQA